VRSYAPAENRGQFCIAVSHDNRGEGLNGECSVKIELPARGDRQQTPDFEFDCRIVDLYALRDVLAAAIRQVETDLPVS
jgi:hypothetical protein